VSGNVAIVRLDCGLCATYFETSSRDVTLVRSNDEHDRLIAHCPNCDRTFVVILSPVEVSRLAGLCPVAGDADIDALIEPADIADIEDLPTKEIPE